MHYPLQARILVIPADEHPSFDRAREYIERLPERELDTLREEYYWLLPEKMGENDTDWYTCARNVLFDAVTYVDRALRGDADGTIVYNRGGLTIIVAVGDSVESSESIDSFVLFEASGAAKAAGFIVD